jgi:hypothetical protein
MRNGVQRGVRGMSRMMLEEAHRRYHSALAIADMMIADTDNEPYSRTKEDAATSICQTAQEPWGVNFTVDPANRRQRPLVRSTP